MKCFIFCACLCAFSCSKKSIFESPEETQVRVVDDTPGDFKIPVALWEDIEAQPKHGDEMVENKSSIIFAPLRVFLIEKNAGVLVKPRVQVDFPRGGGVLDLSEFTTAVEGSFYFGLEIPGIAGLTNLRVFYLSEARKRKIDGEIYGAGCQTYMDISARLNQEMLKEGLKVNTVRNRHTSVLAGNFILTAQKDKRTLVTQVHIVDSKNSNLLCEVTDESKSENPRQ